MTIDEAIKHAEEVAEEEEKQAIWLRSREGNPNYKNCVERAEEQRQLAEWLKELKQLREQTKWIPVKWHEITDEEREREGYPKEWLTVLDCLMPNDEEEILVTIKSSRCGSYVNKDICYVDDGYSLDSGSDWINDVVAWQPLPKPYEVESEG